MSSGSLEHIISNLEPRVIATYKSSRVLKSSAFKITDTSASNPFNNNVLPIARFGKILPSTLFFSLILNAVSKNDAFSELIQILSASIQTLKIVGR